MNFIILSFCIGTYNRSNRVFKLAQSILDCDRDDIEVVIADNCSTDNTYEVLRTIKDKRFKYYRNEHNIGAVANFVRSVTYANGKYAFYCNDRDRINHNNINSLCEFLLIHDLAFAHCGRKYKKNILYSNKYKAFMNLYKPYHPTGAIINTDKLKEIDNLDWFEREENVTIRPFFYISGKLMLMGNSAKISNNYWKMAERDFYLNQSGFHETDMKKLFFHPEHIKKELESVLNYLISLNYFHEESLFNIMLNIYKKYSKRATLEYRYYSSDKFESIHYGYEPIRMNNKSLRNVYKDFHIYFTKYFERNIPFYSEKAYNKLILMCYKIMMYTLINLSILLHSKLFMRLVFAYYGWK